MTIKIITVVTWDMRYGRTSAAFNPYIHCAIDISILLQLGQPRRVIIFFKNNEDNNSVPIFTLQLRSETDIYTPPHPLPLSRDTMSLLSKALRLDHTGQSFRNTSSCIQPAHHCRRGLTTSLSGYSSVLTPL